MSMLYQKRTRFKLSVPLCNGITTVDTEIGTCVMALELAYDSIDLFKDLPVT